MSDSHRQIVSSSALVGGAALVTNGLGIARLKVVALLLGPTGLGVLGVYLNIVAAASMIAGLGFNTSAVREIAAAEGAGKEEQVDAARLALIWGVSLCGLLAAGAIILFRQPLATAILDDPRRATDFGWLGLAVGLSVMSTLLVTLLNAFRRISRLAAVQLWAALLGTIAGLSALLAWGEAGLILYVIAAPASALLVALALWRWLPRPATRPGPRLVSRQFWKLVRLGAPFMVGAVALSIAVLGVRAIVQGRLGATALGHFGAVWTISGTYIAFIITAMSTDFYPRLAALDGDRPASVQLINDQLETAVMLALPILLGVQATAPWLLPLLYSSEFTPAADLLRLQILGDLFKVLSFPLVMALLAAGRGLAYLLLELTIATLFLLMAWAGTAALGLQGAGIGYALTYAIYFIVLLLIARKTIGFRFVREGRLVAVASTGALALLTGVSLAGDVPGLALGTLLSAGALWLAYSRLDRLEAIPAPVARLLRRPGR